MKRKHEREKSFSDLSAKEIGQLFVTDDYFAAEQIFNVLGQDIIVKGGRIAEALLCLPGRKRDIILLSYFLSMTDREIGEKLNMKRITVHYQRKITLNELKKILGEVQADA
jgi:DNA-directed RNA polymerase specialized sigma24 family protein